MSVQKMEATGCVNMRFIVFLKATLAKMVANKFLPDDFIDLQFWESFPHKFYNIKSYDGTKVDFERANPMDDTGLGSEEDVHKSQEEYFDDSDTLVDSQVIIFLLMIIDINENIPFFIIFLFTYSL